MEEGQHNRVFLIFTDKFVHDQDKFCENMSFFLKIADKFVRKNQEHFITINNFGVSNFSEQLQIRVKIKARVGWSGS